MSISEEDLPGIGRRYEIVVGGGQRIVLVIHHSGRRDLYVMDGDRDEPACAVELTDDQARTMGAILGGAFLRPTIAQEIEDLIGELVVDWVMLPERASAVGKSISDLEIHRRGGMSLVALVRGKRAIMPPDPEEVFQSGDRIVVMGRREDMPRFLELVIG